MEKWKTIPFEDKYEVSSEGKVRNIESGHVKNLRFDRYGYLRVTLYPSGKTYTVHKLVASTFLNKPAGCTEINHKNGNKEDNSLTNLEWCTSSYNARHRDTVIISKWKGQLNPSATLDIDTVKSIKYGDFPKLNNREIGDIFNVSAEQVRRIRNGERWGHI